MKQPIEPCAGMEDWHSLFLGFMKEMRREEGLKEERKPNRGPLRSKESNRASVCGLGLLNSAQTPFCLQHVIGTEDEDAKWMVKYATLGIDTHKSSGIKES